MFNETDVRTQTSAHESNFSKYLTHMIAENINKIAATILFSRWPGDKSKCLHLFFAFCFASHCHHFDEIIKYFFFFSCVNRLRLIRVICFLFRVHATCDYTSANFDWINFFFFFMFIVNVKQIYYSIEFADYLLICLKLFLNIFSFFYRFWLQLTRLKIFFHWENNFRSILPMMCSCMISKAANRLPIDWKPFSKWPQFLLMRLRDC